MKKLLRVPVVAALLLSACSARTEDAKKTEVKKKLTEKAKEDSTDAPIGNATMTKDGTIILHLRSKAANGSIGEAQLVYRKDDKPYSEILKHLGGLKPGESKPVRPWPDGQ